MINIKADFNNIIGNIKPVNGFNNASRRTDYGDILDDFKELHAPFCRLHDTGSCFGGGKYVDIQNIFPDFSADVNDPDSYDFTLTDYYIKPLIENNIGIMFRFGTKIEHAPKKYYIYAPSDPQKWAEICEHIVRHYNCGWADGYHWNIEYWEVWNEPDGIDPNIEPYGPPNWIGTAEDYYKLYSLTANEIKSKHPNVKVGGYSSCYILGKFMDGKWVAGHPDYFIGFLEYITTEETKAPLDFFTWHGYLGKRYLEKIKIESDFVDEMLNKYGFTDIPRIDAEWNCNICDKDDHNGRTEYYINFRNEKGASHIAGALYEMQRCKVDIAMYYEAQLWLEYGGLFEVPSLLPTKTYYAFKQFDEMKKLGQYCYSTQEDNVYTCAAHGEYDMLCVSNLNEDFREIKLDIENVKSKIAEIYITNKEHNLEKIGDINLQETDTFTIPEYSFISLKFR